MKKRYLLLAPLLLISVYLLFWPVPINPAAWTPPTSPGYRGPYATNSALAAATRLGEGDCVGPEDIALDEEGRIYGSCVDGRIVRWDKDATNPQTFADTQGRPLGLHFDASGILIVADGIKGLLSIAPDGAITTLATEHAGRPFGFTDDLDIAKDGVIYFSDASSRFGTDSVMLDIFEHQPNGSLLAYDPATKETTLLHDDLYFANGIAVDPDQQFVLVNETTKYRVQKHWIAGPKKGQTEVLIDNLPGIPDGISAGTNGTFWIALYSPRNSLLDKTLPHPFLRKILSRLPAFVQPKPVRYSHILGINANGTVTHNLQDPAGAFAPITSVQEENGDLYLGSLTEPAFARFPRP